MQFKKEEIKGKIIDVARNAFYDKGFEKTSMRHIARSAGVSVSNVYTYFKDKEELFDEIVNPFYQYLSRLIHNLTHDASGEEFSAEYVSSVITEVGGMVKKNRIELNILLDGSCGTRYENSKHELITTFEEHFIEHARSENTETVKGTGEIFIFHLIASHLVEAMLEISRHYAGDEWMDNTIKALIAYHLFGITQFFK